MGEGFANLSYEVLPSLRLVISCQNREFPTDGEWDNWLAAATQLRQQSNDFRLLVMTEGGHPSRTQLERLRQTNGGCNPLTSIVSPSLGYRFMAAALTFINPKIRCFALDEVDKAFQHVGMTPVDRTRVRLVVDKLSQQLKGSPSFLR